MHYSYDCWGAIVSAIKERATDLDGDGVPDSHAEQIMWGLGIILVLTSTFWLSFWVSSLLSFHWLPLRALANLPQAVVGMISHKGDPGAGWNGTPWEHSIAPRPIFILVFMAVVYGEYHGIKLLLAKKREWQYKGVEDAAHWASDGELKEILDPPTYPLLQMVGYKAKPAKGVVLGLTEDSKRVVRLQPQNHAIIVAGTRSGKTAGLCTPALLSFDGICIATSVKDDLVKDTLAERKKRGQVFIFDPARQLDIDDKDISYWSPLDSIKEWRDAMRVSEALLSSGMGKGGGGDTMGYFRAMAQQMFPVLLYAAAVHGHDMRMVMKWLHGIDSPQTHAEVHAILRWKKNTDALRTWKGFLARPPKSRGDISSTVQSALVPYEDPKIQQSAIVVDKPLHQQISPEALFDGGQNTLYIVAAPSDLERLEAVFVALIQGLLEYVTDLPRNLETPCLVVLDEAANISALPKLPTFLSTIGSKNVSIITSWQDFAQINNRYGDAKNTILNNSRGKIILPGVSDPETLNYFKDITGEAVHESVSVSRSESDSKKSGRQLSIGEQRRHLLNQVTLVQQEFGNGILVYGNLPPARLQLRLFFKDPELREKVGLPAIPWWEQILGDKPIIGRFIKKTQ